MSLSGGKASTQEQADTVASVHNFAKICPTLFIALGGTGAEIALRLRRRILSHVWGCNNNLVQLDSVNDFPLAQFIYYDLDAGYLLKSEKAATSDPLSELVKFSEEEKLIFKLDMDKYLRSDGELNRYPHITEWFPLTRKKFLELGVDPSWSGKWNIRCMSRLYFFDKYTLLKSMIEGKIRALLYGVSSKNKTEHLGLEIEPASLRIVIIASTAGCTGSGSFIDMGYLAKLLAKKQLLGTKVDLCVMLPSGRHAGYSKTRNEANTYAALTELETCMAQGLKFVKNWKNGEDLELPNKPYDDVFLFDNSNLANKNQEKATDLFDMVADSLFDDFIPSDFSSRKKSWRVHHTVYKAGSFSLPVDHVTYGSMKMMYSKSYSTFGQSVIEAKLNQLQDDIVYEKIADTPLTKMLEKMNISDRRCLFQNCMESAMPWVDANVSILGDSTNQYTCLVGIDGTKLFEQKFGEEFKSVVPTKIGISPRSINFCESGIPNKLNCYVELNGIPLATLTQLPHWRKSYEEENKKIPVHIHKDKSLFVHPLAPSSSELARLAEHFKLYIQGIILGVLNLRIDDTEERLYCLTVSGGELSIGNERTIRMEGIASEHLMYLKKKVTDAINRIKTPVQYAGLVVLYDFYSQYVYPPAILRYDGIDSDVEGFANVMCSILGDESRKVLSEASDIDPSKLFARLEDNLAIWTDEIEGSDNDVYPNEVDKSHMPKRILKSEFFQTGWLEQHISIMIPERPPLPEIPVYVAVNGQQTGPFSMTTLHKMVKLGQLTGDSLVWMQGMEKWETASTVTSITSVFNAIPSLDDKTQLID